MCKYLFDIGSQFDACIKSGLIDFILVFNNSDRVKFLVLYYVVILADAWEILDLASVVK